MKALFSVIIPTLNEELFIPNLLEDLKKQKFKNFEVLVVDGKSKDKTFETVQKFSDSLKLEFHKSPKKNVSFQRNYGAQKANGEFLVFLDADSRVPANFLITIKKNIDKHKHLLYIPSITFPKNSYEYQLLENFMNFIVEASQHIYKPFSNGGSIIMHKETFLFIGMFNEKLYLSEDHELIQRAKKYGILSKFIKDTSFVFSLRRIDKEGRLKLMSKYVYAVTRVIVKGNIEHKIFNYEMGGHEYQMETRNETITSANIKEQYKKYKKQLDKLFN